MKTGFRALALILLLFAPSMTFAHSGAGAHEHGFVSGFLHPLGGLDHVLAMVAVGLLAAHLGGRALFLVPAAFMAAMAFGGWLGVAGVKLPFVETGIALSVIVLGALVAARANLALVIAMTVSAVFAVFHGYAHGAELPGGASALVYGAGFVAATAALHLIGIALGMSLGAIASAHLVRISGSAIALAGVAILLRAI